MSLYDTHTNGQRIYVLRSVGTGSEGLTISTRLHVAFLLTSAHQHCVVLLFVACLPFLRNVRRCRGAGGRHCCREMPTVYGHIAWRHPQCWRQTLSLGEVLFQPGSETSSLLAANASVSRTRFTVFLALGTSLQSLSVSNRHAPLPGLFLGSPPLALVIWAFPWCPSGTEVSETRHSLIVYLLPVRLDEPAAGSRHHLPLFLRISFLV